MSRLNAKQRASVANALSIPDKANRILNLLLVIFFLYLIRIWHLAVIQHDERLEEARRPQRRVVIERAERATIRDRFNKALAINKVQYNASISYAAIRDVPRVSWSVDEKGRRVKRMLRKEHISSLVTVLGKELGLDPLRLEDLIYSKAAIHPSLPLVIKEDITESEYYRLKMLERQWPGIVAERVSKRHYPCGSHAGDILGYMGSISKEKYDAILEEMHRLERYLKEREMGLEPPLLDGYSSPTHIAVRLKELQERTYTLNDYIGKSGIESLFDEQLRGFRGKKTYYSDTRGNYLRELPGSREPLSGQRLLLTISSELQAYAEKLLVISETLREGRSFRRDRDTRALHPFKQPWIKGGAIVVMEPNTGEILALASHPRFDPNDFIPSAHADANEQKLSNVRRWLESEAHIAELWDGKTTLKRDLFSFTQKQCSVEQAELSWEYYLQQILPDEHPIRLKLASCNNVSTAIFLQQALESCMHASSKEELIEALRNFEVGDAYFGRGVTQKAWATLKQALAFSTSLYDRLLFLDLLRVAVSHERFSPLVCKTVGGLTLDEYKRASQAYVAIHDVVKKLVRGVFHEEEFQAWRQLHEKAFLKEMRQIEAARKLYNRPYIDYFDKKEEELFTEFWDIHKYDLLAAFLGGASTQEVFPAYLDMLSIWEKELSSGAHGGLKWHSSYRFLRDIFLELPRDAQIPFLQTLRGFGALNRPLLGHYNALRRLGDVQLEKHLAAAFYPIHGFGYVRPYAYQQSAPQGSIFKLVTAYTTLMQLYQDHHHTGLNPLTIIDDVQRDGSKQNSWIVGYTLDKKPIPQIYKGGRLPRSSHSHIGKIDLVGAIESSSNPYFSLLAGEILEDPESLIETAKNFSFGAKTGIALPSESKGLLPKDVCANKTGLYALAIGQHSLMTTPLQTASMLCTLANGGKVLQPKIALLAAGKEPLRGESDLFSKEHYHYQDLLSFVGLDFPLFTQAEGTTKRNLVTHFPTKVVREIPLPQQIRQILLNGMRQVVIGERGSARPSVIRSYHKYPEALRDYKELCNQMLGKTGTAEKVERIDLDETNGLQLASHLWFGAISFSKEPSSNFERPELVVVVFLPYGDYGKEAAPLSAQIIKKWREIKQHH